MSKRPTYYKGFYICQTMFGLFNSYFLIIREGEWDYYQIPFWSVESAQSCIDKMHETGKEAFYENGEIVYRDKGEIYGDDSDGACAEV